MLASVFASVIALGLLDSGHIAGLALAETGAAAVMAKSAFFTVGVHPINKAAIAAVYCLANIKSSPRGNL